MNSTGCFSLCLEKHFSLLKQIDSACAQIKNDLYKNSKHRRTKLQSKQQNIKPSSQIWFIKASMFYNLLRPVDLGRLCVQPHPSARDSFPLVTCGFLQRRTKGRPSGRLHFDAQVSQQETPKLYTSVSEHREWHSEGGQKETVYCVSFLPLANNHSLVPCASCQNSRKQLEYTPGKYPKSSNPVSNIQGAISATPAFKAP